jgi:hypothetical protein
MAAYCIRALQRAMHCGCRKERPSKLETASILTRNPCVTKMPHSISVRLPNDAYHVSACLCLYKHLPASNP